MEKQTYNLTGVFPRNTSPRIVGTVSYSATMKPVMPVSMILWRGVANFYCDRLKQLNCWIAYQPDRSNLISDHCDCDV
jgi:hypothetical protein